MLDLKCKIIETGSTGNGYLFYCNKFSFAIDAGVKLKSYLKYIPDIATFIGLFVTHEHLDHSKYLYQFIDFGIDIYTSKGTANALGIEHYNRLKHAEKTTFDSGLEITPLDLIHNANEPLGFVISYMGIKTFFATDTCAIPYRIRGINHFIIEANHDSRLMDDSIVSVNSSKNHMNINNAIDFIENNNFGITESVTMIHLSSRNANPEDFILKMSKVTNGIVRVGTNGLEINLGL